MEQLKHTYARRTWEDWYADAKKYYEEHHDLLIPRLYVTSANFRLGRWIERQRAIYNGTISGTMTEDRIIMLNQINMIWKLENRYPFDVWIKKAKEYFDIYGDLAVETNCVFDGFALGNWINEIRKKYSKGLLNVSQIEALQNCGMIWSYGTRRSFSDWYKDALDYYFKFGDLQVTTNYVTKDGYRLGQWISIQRSKYSKNTGYRFLSKKEISLLNQLDMVWNIEDIRDKKWNETYKSVLEYKKLNGKLPLWPNNLTASNGIYMPRWISYQKQLLRNNKLNNYKIKKLSEIGIV